MRLWEALWAVAITGMSRIRVRDSHRSADRERDGSEEEGHSPYCKGVGWSLDRVTRVQNSSYSELQCLLA